MQYRKYDIVLADLGEALFDGEQGGIRPVLIIQNNIGNLHSPSTIVMSITTKIKNLYMPTHMILEKDDTKGLNKDSMLLGECVRQISNERIVKYIGKITNEEEKKQIKQVYLANFGEGE